MSDEIDRANDQAQIWLDAVLDGKRYELPEGKPGQCEECGEWSQRLVGGHCAPCREDVERFRG